MMVSNPLRDELIAVHRMPPPRPDCPLYQRLRRSIDGLVPRSRERERRKLEIGSELCWLAVRLSSFRRPI